MKRNKTTLTKVTKTANKVAYHVSAIVKNTALAFVGIFPPDISLVVEHKKD